MHEHVPEDHEYKNKIYYLLNSGVGTAAGGGAAGVGTKGSGASATGIDTGITGADGVISTSSFRLSIPGKDGKILKQ